MARYSDGDSSGGPPGAGPPGATGPPPSAAYLAETLVPGLTAAILVGFITATIAVVARLYSRLVLLRTWDWGDTFLVIGWVCGVANTVINFILIKHGTGRHYQLATLDDARKELLYAYIVRIVYQLALSFTKLCVAWFYLRIFHTRVDRLIARGLLVFIVLWTVPIILVMLFQCTPIKDIWSVPPKNESCTINDSGLLIACGTINVFSDISLMAFVVPKILALKMPTKQKVVLMAIILTSLLVVVAGIIRTVLATRALQQLDGTWNYAHIGIWSSIEVTTSMICASVIAIRPLIRQIFPRLLPTSATHQYSTSGRPRAGTKPLSSSTATDEEGGKWQCTHSHENVAGDVDLAVYDEAGRNSHTPMGMGMVHERPMWKDRLRGEAPSPTAKNHVSILKTTDITTTMNRQDEEEEEGSRTGSRGTDEMEVEEKDAPSVHASENGYDSDELFVGTGIGPTTRRGGGMRELQ